MEKIYIWVDDGEQSVKAQELLHKLGYTPIFNVVRPLHLDIRHYIRTEGYGMNYGTEHSLLKKYGGCCREVTLTELENIVKEKEVSKLRTKEDYHKMKPTDKVEVVVDGHKFDVDLKSLVLLTDVLGNSVRNSLYYVSVQFDKIFGTRQSSNESYNLEALVDDVTDYFLPEETAKKLNEIESINETIKELQNKVNSLKESL